MHAFKRHACDLMSRIWPRRFSINTTTSQQQLENEQTEEATHWNIFYRRTKWFASCVAVAMRSVCNCNGVVWAHRELLATVGLQRCCLCICALGKLIENRHWPWNVGFWLNYKCVAPRMQQQAATCDMGVFVWCWAIGQSNTHTNALQCPHTSVIIMVGSCELVISHPPHSATVANKRERAHMKRLIHTAGFHSKNNSVCCCCFFTHFFSMS